MHQLTKILCWLWIKNPQLLHLCDWSILQDIGLLLGGWEAKENNREGSGGGEGGGEITRGKGTVAQNEWAFPSVLSHIESHVEKGFTSQTRNHCVGKQSSRKKKRESGHILLLGRHWKGKTLLVVPQSGKRYMQDKQLNREQDMERIPLAEKRDASLVNKASLSNFSSLQLLQNVSLFSIRACTLAERRRKTGQEKTFTFARGERRWRRGAKSLHINTHYFLKCSEHLFQSEDSYSLQW